MTRPEVLKQAMYPDTSKPCSFTNEKLHRAYLRSSKDLDRYSGEKGFKVSFEANSLNDYITTLKLTKILSRDKKRISYCLGGQAIIIKKVENKYLNLKELISDLFSVLNTTTILIPDEPTPLYLKSVRVAMYNTSIYNADLIPKEVE